MKSRVHNGSEILRYWEGVISLYQQYLDHGEKRFNYVEDPLVDFVKFIYSPDKHSLLKQEENHIYDIIKSTFGRIPEKLDPNYAYDAFVSLFLENNGSPFVSTLSYKIDFNEKSYPYDLAMRLLANNFSLRLPIHSKYASMNDFKKDILLSDTINKKEYGYIIEGITSEGFPFRVYFATTDVRNIEKDILYSDNLFRSRDEEKGKRLHEVLEMLRRISH